MIIPQTGKFIKKNLLLIVLEAEKYNIEDLRSAVGSFLLEPMQKTSRGNREGRPESLMG
jgi:hypothetical protein